MKTLGAESASRIQLLCFADGMRLMENGYLRDSLVYFKKSPVSIHGAWFAVVPAFQALRISKNRGPFLLFPLSGLHDLFEIRSDEVSCRNTIKDL